MNPAQYLNKGAFMNRLVFNLHDSSLYGECYIATSLQSNIDTINDEMLN